MKYLAVFCVLALPLAADAQDHARHDIALNAIRNVKAVVDTTIPATTQTIGVAITTIVGTVGNVGDPIPGCVGRVCGAIP